MDEYDFKQQMVNCEPMAIETLKRVMRGGDQNALKAAEMVLSYTQGKPEQKVSGDVGLTIKIRHFMEDPVTGEVIEHISTKGPEKEKLGYKPQLQAPVTDAQYTEEKPIGTMKEF